MSRPGTVVYYKQHHPSVVMLTTNKVNRNVQGTNPNHEGGGNGRSKSFEQVLHAIKTGAGEIELVDIALSLEQVHELSSALRSRNDKAHAAGVRTLKLTRCGLDDGKLVLILDALPTKTIEVFSLWWNEFTDRSIPAIASRAQDCERLYQIDLYGNRSISNISSFLTLTFRKLGIVGLGSTQVMESEKELLRSRFRVMHAERTRLILSLCCAYLPASKRSHLRTLPIDLIRHLMRMLPST
jgi:hypothetical protein